MIKDRIKAFRRVPVSELKPNPKNWRTHPPEQADAMRGILAEVGFADAALARETPDGLQLIDGHLRADIAPDAEMPVLVLDVTEEEADRILATHDPIAAMAGSDANALAELLDGMKFDNDATQSMLDDLADGVIDDAPVDIEEDETPEPPAEPITQLGDLWQLGRHRLLCGDCTNEGDVSRLLDNHTIDAVLTDPPYGIKRDKGFSGSDGFNGNKTLKPIKRRTYDDNWDSSRPSADTFTQLTATAPLSIIFGGNFFADLLPVSTHWLVWDKEQTMPTFGDCELAWTNSTRTSVTLYKHAWNGLIGKEKERYHPTQKPVALFASILNDYTDDGETIFDPFLGSGTTLIAAEQLDRTCYGMEISPSYCDVIVERWENLTGDKAKKQEVK